MSRYSANKRLYEIQLNNMRLDLERSKEANKQIKKLRSRESYAKLLMENIDNYLNKLKFLKKVIIVEETNFRERRIDYINTNITEALLKIFPEENFTASVDCDIYRGKSYAQLVLRDPSGNERLPHIQEGKMCQYLISFAAVKGVTTALGSDVIYIDEAFGAASSDNIQKMGPILNEIVESGVQIILVSQNSNLYSNVPHREIIFHKDPVQKKVIVDEISDYNTDCGTEETIFIKDELTS